MKAQKESTLRKASLPVCLLIIQKLEEVFCHPLVVNARPAELTPSSDNVEF